MDTFYSSLEHVDLSEETYHVLKAKILQRQLTPGSKISVNEVADGLGVSRTPVVVALQRLCGEGLVEIVPRRGTFVRGMTIEEVEEVFEVRRMIEQYAAQNIILTGKVKQFLQAIQSSLVLMDQAISGEEFTDYQGFMKADQDLHLLMVSQTENQRIIDIYRDLNVHMHVVRAHHVDDVEKAIQTQREHSALINAFELGDLEKTQEAINFHVNNVKSRIIDLIQEHGGQI